MLEGNSYSGQNKVLEEPSASLHCEDQREAMTLNWLLYPGSNTLGPPASELKIL